MKSFFTIFILIIATISQAQDKQYACKVIDTLTSEEMAGRGYLEDGEKKAAEYIFNEYKQIGLKSFSESYYQRFTMPVNCISGKTTVEVDGKVLIEARDYFISSDCKGVEKEFELVWLSYKTAKKKSRLLRFLKQDLKGKIVVLDPNILRSKNEMALIAISTFYRGSTDLAAGVITFAEKPIWGVSNAGSENDYLFLTVKEELITKRNKKIKIAFENTFTESYEAKNVVGYIPGTENPEKYIVYTAHFDHLGIMGETYIPGANDNASGTAMILDLARYYIDNPPPFSVVFIAFSAEERGLLGSKKFVSEPLMPLEKITFLLNLDMVGTGKDGITVVNGSQFKDEFNLMDSINSANDLLVDVKKRGKSKNSDHFPFFEKGVRCFFIYSRDSEYTDYHNPDDHPSILPLTEYEDIFKLLVIFSDAIYNT